MPVIAATSQGVRDTAFASRHRNRFAIRNARFKLIREPDGEQLYDMQTDRHTESNDLLRDGKLDPNAEANHRSLSLALDELIAPAQNACPIVSEIQVASAANRRRAQIE